MLHQSHTDIWLTDFMECLLPLLSADICFLNRIGFIFLILITILERKRSYTFWLWYAEECCFAITTEVATTRNCFLFPNDTSHENLIHQLLPSLWSLACPINLYFVIDIENIFSLYTVNWIFPIVTSNIERTHFLKYQLFLSVA